MKKSRPYVYTAIAFINLFGALLVVQSTPAKIALGVAGLAAAALAAIYFTEKPET